MPYNQLPPNMYAAQNQGPVMPKYENRVVPQPMPQQAPQGQGIWDQVASYFITKPGSIDDLTPSAPGWGKPVHDFDPASAAGAARGSLQKR